MLHLPHRQCTARFLVAVAVRVGCHGRERGRVLAYVRATALGDAEVHAQEQASATHRRQPLKIKCEHSDTHYEARTLNHVQTQDRRIESNPITGQQSEETHTHKHSRTRTRTHMHTCLHE